MLNQEQMKLKANQYQISFDEIYKDVYIIHDGKNQNWVKISLKRAIEWVNAGIDDIDCRTKQAMLDLINSWQTKGGVIQ